MSGRAFCLIFVALIAASFADAATVPEWNPEQYRCSCRPRDTSCVCASTTPPGWLSQEETPQFIVFTHDDAITPETDTAFRAILDGRQSANGCPAVATMFTLARATDCSLLRKMYKDGYEISSHSLTHQKMNAYSRAEVEEEVVGGRAAIASTCGIPESDIAGFRQPYLQSSPLVRQVLHDNGFQYDSTLIEDNTGSLSQGLEARLWPYTLQDGVAHNCARWSPYQTCSEGESYPGLFEVPVWDMAPTGIFSTENGANESATLAILKTIFDEAYTGNRAPMPVFVHTFWFTPQTVAAMQKFADYVLSKPDVYFVTVRQLVAWMQHPVPASELTPALLGCGNQGGAGPSGSAGTASGAGGAGGAGSEEQQAHAASVDPSHPPPTMVLISPAPSNSSESTSATGAPVHNPTQPPLHTLSQPMAVTNLGVVTITERSSHSGIDNVVGAGSPTLVAENTAADTTVLDARQWATPAEAASSELQTAPAPSPSASRTSSCQPRAAAATAGAAAGLAWLALALLL